MVISAIREIWSRELELKEFADTDDFFVLGGHSLIMARVQQALATELNVDVSMEQLFRNSTVASIAAHIESIVAVS